MNQAVFYHLFLSNCDGSLGFPFLADGVVPCSTVAYLLQGSCVGSAYPL